MADQEAAFAELVRCFNSWPTIADVRPDRNPLLALSAYIDTLDRPSLDADRYIQATLSGGVLTLWRGRGKALPTKRFRHYTSDLPAAIALYTMFPGLELPDRVPSTPLECTKDALRQIVEKVMANV